MTIKDLQKKLNRLLPEAINRDLMTDIAKAVQTNVKARTRRGYGVDKEGAPAKKLKPLSDTYKKERKRLKAKGELHPETTPNKSNLTKTGAMIDSVDFEVTSNNEARIFVSGEANEKKARYNAEKDRKFMDLSRREIKDITDIVEERLNKGIKKG